MGIEILYQDIYRKELTMGGPGSGPRKGHSRGGGAKAESFSLNLGKMKSNPMPKALKKQFQKAGGVNSSAYKSWIKKNWT
jgi:hypothetical protein